MLLLVPPVAVTASSHIAEKVLITAGLALALKGVARILRPSDMKTTYPIYRDVTGEIIKSYADTSALTACDWYEARRPTDAPGFTPGLAPGPNDEQIDASLSWALASLWGESPDLELAQKQVVGAAQKMTADAARQTITDNVQRDKTATGFARHAEPNACYFCALIATRGPVYKTHQQAGTVANQRFVGNDSIIKYHDHCHCTPVPIFEGETYTPAAHIDEWDRLYRQSTGDVSGNEKIRAFRRAYENPPGADSPGD